MQKKYKIYIMYTGVFCKIGVTSRKLSERIKEIQTSCPLPIFEYDEIGLLSKSTAFYVEKIVKKHLSEHHTFGEWFKEFPSIKKSVSYLIKTHSHESYTIKSFNTKNKKFEDISIQLFNRIQYARKNHDISKLSQLYTNFIKEKNLINTDAIVNPKKHKEISSKEKRKRQEKAMAKFRRNNSWLYKEEV